MVTEKKSKQAEIERWARWVVEEVGDDPKELALVVEVIEALAARARSRRRV